MQRYFKILHQDGGIGLFSSNNEEMINSSIKALEESGDKVIEINESRYNRLEREYD